MTKKQVISTLLSKSGKASMVLMASLLIVGGLQANKVFGGGGDPCEDGIPDAFFSIEPGDKAVGQLSASFDGNVSVACDHAIVSYAWDFGDGATASGSNVTHDYPVGTYRPSLTITDAIGQTSTFTYGTDVIVKATNQAPVLNDISQTVVQGGSLSINVSSQGSDSDGDDIVHGYYLPQDAQYGSTVTTPKGYVMRTSDAGIFNYSAQANASGQDTFQVALADGFGGIATATVTVDITPHVTAVSDTATTQEGQDITIPVTANDFSHENQAFEIYWSQSHPETGGHIVNVNKVDGTVTFRPDPGFVGTAQFEYGIKSLEPNTWRISQTSVSVVVTPDPNQAPVAANDTVDTDEDVSTAIAVQANDTDPNGDALTTSVVTGPQHGTISINPDGTIQYTPHANYHGTDTATYRVSDPAGKSATATVAIVVRPVNDAPQASFVWTVTGSGTVTFNAAASADVDNAIVSYQWNFGDGAVETTTAATTSHKYKGKTARVVTLTVTDAAGLQATYTSTVTP